MLSRLAIRSVAAATIAALTLAACVGPRARVRREVVNEPAPVPPPNTQVFFYPTAGQSPEQQNRDRYECYQWAVKQTGFDPSRADLAPHQRVEVVPAAPSGHDTAVGAVTGAMIGAAVSRPREAAGGAILGAVAGAIVGASSDAAREQHAENIQRRYDARDAQHMANIDQQAGSYRRAMGACLEGRGYQVK